MKFMLAIYGDSSTWGSQSDEEAKAELDAFAAFEREAKQARVLVTREALEGEGSRLSSEDGEGELMDPEKRLGCFYILECSDMGEAKQWAARVPLVGPGGFHTIEIRPVMPPPPALEEA
jgi:hypothetical protein